MIIELNTELKRVVITGMGLVTPLGSDIDTFWQNIKSGKNAIDEITRFDTTDFRVKLAAEVKDFDPALYMGKADIRKNDRFVQFALASARQAVDDSGIEGNISEERLGVYYGSGVGGIIIFWQGDRFGYLPFLSPR